MTSDLANWMVPGATVKGMGSAMDLVSGASRVIVLTDHLTKTGAPELVTACDLPPTGRHVVSRIITDLGVLDVSGIGFEVIEFHPVWTMSKWPPTPRRQSLMAATMFDHPRDTQVPFWFGLMNHRLHDRVIVRSRIAIVGDGIGGVAVTAFPDREGVPRVVTASLIARGYKRRNTWDCSAKNARYKWSPPASPTRRTRG